MSRMKESLHPKILQILILAGVVRGPFLRLACPSRSEIFNSLGTLRRASTRRHLPGA